MEPFVERKLVELARCPICGSDDFTPIEIPMRFVDEEYRKFTGVPGYSAWHSCGDCSLLFQNPAPGENALNAFYQSSEHGYTASETIAGYKENSLFFHPHTRQKARLMLRFGCRALGHRPYRILELGCGFGKLGRVFREWNYHYTGVEPSEIRRECARQFGLDVHSSLESITERDFDLVVSNHVLEHVPDPVGFLRASAPLCAKVFAHVHVLPTHASGTSPRLFEAFCLAHLYMFSQTSFARVYAKAGLAGSFCEYGPLGAYDSELWTAASSAPSSPLTPPPIENRAVLTQSMQRALAWSSLSAARWKLEVFRLRATAFFFRRFGDPVYRHPPASGRLP